VDVNISDPAPQLVDLCAQFCVPKPVGIAMIGASPEGERAIRIFRNLGWDVVGIYDADVGKIGKEFCGLRVKSTGDVVDLDRTTRVVVASHKGAVSLREVRERGFDFVVSFPSLQCVLPQLFEPHVFYRNWYADLANESVEIEWLSRHFGDAKSRETLAAILEWRRTFDDSLVAQYITKYPYFADDIDGLSVAGTYVDAGAYNGDSAMLFIERASHYERIYAFEPDPKTFETLQANFSENSKVIPVRAGIGARKSIERFRSDSSRAALFADDGDIEVEITSIDEYFGDDAVTYIKMNIEGLELDALNGARAVIGKHHPFLAIAAYHAPNHLWKVPRIITELSPGYRLFLRQHDVGSVETVIYGVPVD